MAPIFSAYTDRLSISSPISCRSHPCLPPSSTHWKRICTGTETCRDAGYILERRTHLFSERIKCFWPRSTPFSVQYHHHVGCFDGHGIGRYFATADLGDHFLHFLEISRAVHGPPAAWLFYGGGQRAASKHRVSTAKSPSSSLGMNSPPMFSNMITDIPNMQNGGSDHQDGESSTRPPGRL